MRGAYCTLQWCLLPCGLSVVTPLAPITLQQLWGIYRVWVKGVKNTGEGGWGRRAGKEESLCWVEGLQKQSPSLKTKFTTEGKQQGRQKSLWVRRERKRKKWKRKWGRIWTVVGWGPKPRLLLPLPPSLAESPALTQQNPPQAQPHQERLATL